MAKRVPTPAGESSLWMTAPTMPPSTVVFGRSAHNAGPGAWPLPWRSCQHSSPGGAPQPGNTPEGRLKQSAAWRPSLRGLRELGGDGVLAELIEGELAIG